MTSTKTKIDAITAIEPTKTRIGMTTRIDAKSKIDARTRIDAKTAIEPTKMTMRSQMDKTVKKPPQNRNVYESIGGQASARQGSTERGSRKGKSAPVNRNVYEDVGGATRRSKSGIQNRNIYEEIGGKGKSGVVNRNVYEEILKSKAKPGVGAGYVMLDKTGTSTVRGGADASKMATEMTEMTRTETTTRRARRRRRWFLAKESKRVKRVKTMVIFCSMLIAFIVVLAAAGAGIYLIIEKDLAGGKPRQARRWRNRTLKPTPTGTVGPISDASYGYDLCKNVFEDDYSSVTGKDECVIVAPPVGSRGECNKVICEAHFFAASERLTYMNGFLTPRFDTKVQRVKTNESIFCRPTTDENETMVCVSGHCDREYGGGENLLTKDEYTGWWEDNCDEPSPCWDLGHLEAGQQFFNYKDNKAIFDRSRCLNATVQPCSGQFRSNVFWLQHLYCEMNPEQVGTYCPGLPLRLWECRTCRDRSRLFPWKEMSAQVLCQQRNEALLGYDNCTYTCRSASSNSNRTAPFPAGVPCESQEYGYCAFGYCFQVEKEYRVNGSGFSSLRNVTQCLDDRNDRRAKRVRRFKGPKSIR